MAKFTAFGKTKAITYAMVKTPRAGRSTTSRGGPAASDLRAMLTELKAEHTKSQ